MFFCFEAVLNGFAVSILGRFVFSFFCLNYLVLQNHSIVQNDLEAEKNGHILSKTKIAYCALEMVNIFWPHIRGLFLRPAVEQWVEIGLNAAYRILFSVNSYLSLGGVACALSLIAYVDTVLMILQGLQVVEDRILSCVFSVSSRRITSQS